jgi:hypothetical protein
MMCIFYKTDRIPTWCLSYLINGDDSSLTPEEKASVESYVERRTKELTDFSHASLHSVIFDSEDHSYFSWSNDMNQLGGEVVDCYVSGVYRSQA